MEENMQIPLMPSADENTEKEKDKHDGQDTSFTTRGFQTRFLFTIFLFVVYFAQGACNNVLGPSMLDLEYLTDSATDSVAVAFTWRYGFYLISSILTGPIVDTIDECVVNAMALLIMGLSTALMPAFRSLLGLYITNAFVGIGAAVNSIGVAATLIEVWGDEVKPYQQALHLCRTLGSALTPQLMKLYTGLAIVTKQSWESQYNSSFHHGGSLTYLQRNISDKVLIINDTSHGLYKYISDTHILHSFMIIAGLLLTLSVISFVIFICYGCRFWKKTHKDTTVGEKAVISGKLKVVVLALFFLQSMMYAGIEEVVGGLLVAFVVVFLGWSMELGSNLATFFFICMTLSRVIGIIVAKYFKLSGLFVLQLGTILVSIVILIFAIHTHWIVIWICFAGIGLGGGSLFPTLINWGQECMNLQGKEMAVFFAGTACAKMVFPPLIGYLFENVGAIWFLYLILAQVVFFILCYITTVMFIHCLMGINQREMIHEKSPLVPSRND